MDNSRKDVIIALDFPDAEKAFGFLGVFKEKKPYVKVGMELFYAAGPDIVRKLREKGHKVFLDLKLHDIPNTVQSAMRVLSSLGADMVNVHAAGGLKMMAAAAEAFREGAAKAGCEPLVIAVTQLTSTDSEMLRNELLIERSLQETVIEYAKNVKAAGLDGVVCSPLESGLIHETCGSGFLTVTPGIRFADSKADDQKRITTPADARTLGSDFIVVGRPITRAEDPAAAYERCMSEFL